MLFSDVVMGKPFSLSDLQTIYNFFVKELMLELNEIKFSTIPAMIIYIYIYR